MKDPVSKPELFSRVPAPDVSPVVLGHVRYEQLKNGLLAGLDQMAGYLAAFVANTDERLWVLKVYENFRDGRIEGDVQDVFFKAMTVQADGNLLIENERGERFEVNPAKRGVSRLPAK